MSARNALKGGLQPEKVLETHKWIAKVVLSGIEGAYSKVKLSVVNAVSCWPFEDTRAP